MSKNQRPLRRAYDELFDVEWNYQKTEEVRTAYKNFYETLDEEIVAILGTMLL